MISMTARTKAQGDSNHDLSHDDGEADTVNVWPMTPNLRIHMTTSVWPMIPDVRIHMTTRL